MYDFRCLIFQDFQISNLGNKSTLTIMEVFPEDEGHYSCRAINSEGEITSNCQLLVEGRRLSVRLCCSLQSDCLCGVGLIDCSCQCIIIILAINIMILVGPMVKSGNQNNKIKFVECVSIF